MSNYINGTRGGPAQVVNTLTPVGKMSAGTSVGSVGFCAQENCVFRFQNGIKKSMSTWKLAKF